MTGLPEGRSRAATLAGIIAFLLARPGEVATWRNEGLTADLLLRRHVRAALRAALRAAAAAGATVEADERRGLLSSSFTIRVTGTSDQLLQALESLARLERRWG